MKGNKENKGSEVAALMAQISAEQEAARLGMQGLAEGTARHQFICASYGRLDGYTQRLEAIVGDHDTAWALICKAVEGQVTP